MSRKKKEYPLIISCAESLKRSRTVKMQDYFDFVQQESGKNLKKIQRKRKKRLANDGVK